MFDYFRRDRRRERAAARQRAAAKKQRRAARRNGGIPPRPLSPYRSPEDEFITRYGDPFD